MTRLLSLFSTLLVFIVAGVVPHTAKAGGYDVIACNPTVGGGANHSWGPAADAGMTAYTDCPSGQGIMARNVYDGAASGFLQGAYMIFDAPAGNSIDSVSSEAGMRRPDCNWGVQLVAGNADLGGNVLFGLPPGQACDSQFQVDENTFFAGRLAYGVGAPRVRIEARCGAGSCTRNGVASIHIRNVDVRVRDDVAPALVNGHGPLWTSNAWLSGTQSIGFGGSDGAGIQQLSVSVDGQTVASQAGACDYTYTSPCPQLTLDRALATAGFGGDGPHTITLSAIDGGGNPSSYSRTAYIDNTAPNPPKDLTVVGGDGWRSTNDFAIKWTNTPSPVGAPVVAASWELCPTPLGDAKPTRAAQYWATFAKLCRDTYHCSVAAGEFVDGSDYSSSYFSTYKSALTRQPTVWAFHPYIAANSPSASRYERFDRFIQGTRRTDGHASPKIWITEAGGIVHSKAFPNGTEATAQTGTRRLINDVVNRSSRISRLYYYALLGDPVTPGHPNAFDSGLLRYTDLSPRPMYYDYKAKTNPATAP